MRRSDGTMSRRDRRACEAFGLRRPLNAAQHVITWNDLSNYTVTYGTSANSGALWNVRNVRPGNIFITNI